MHLDVPNKKMLTEVQIAQTRMMLLMTYNPSKTSYENISEQEKDNWLVRAAKTISPKGMEDYSQGSWTEIGEWIKTWDHHDWLNFAEIVAGIIAMSNPVGWIGLAASGLALSFGGANAISYYNEGDKYTAGLILMFSLIPAGILMRQFKSIAKYGPKKVFESMKVVKSGGGTETQKKIAKEVSEELGKKGDVVNNLIGKEFVKQFLSRLLKSSTKALVGTLALAKKAGLLVGTAGLTIGGINYAWDKIYSLMGKNEKEIDTKSPLRQVVKLINNNPERIRKEAEEDVISLFENIKPEDLGKIDINKQKEILDSLSSSNKQKKY